jgi:hypothetical protein
VVLRLVDVDREHVIARLDRERPAGINCGVHSDPSLRRRSVVVLDEEGRATGPNDGVSKGQRPLTLTLR